MFIQNASTCDLNRLLCVIYDRMPSLRHLKNDVILMILQFLDCQSRINLIQALCERKNDSLTSKCLHENGLLFTFLLELGTRSVRESINMFADRVFYLIPSFFNAATMVFIDWTPFANRNISSAAIVYWCAKAPHCRVDFDHGCIRRAVCRTISRKSCVIRLTGHTTGEIAPLNDSVEVNVGGANMYIAVNPILSVDAIILNKLEWMKRPDVLLRSMPLHEPFHHRHQHSSTAYASNLKACG